MNIQIRKGGTLIRTDWIYRDADDNGRYVDRDVTDNIPRYIFNDCSIADDVTVKDILLLIRRHMSFFSECVSGWLKEFVREGLVKPEKDTNLSYAELYWHIENDECGVCGNSMPYFHAIDNDGDAWCVSGLPLYKYAHIPIKLSNTMTIFTFLGEPGKYDIQTFDNPKYTLGQIINGFIYEISYYGPPTKRDRTMETIRKDCLDALEKMDSLD